MDRLSQASFTAVMSTTDPPILITSGTGKTGRRIAQRLQNAGHRVRIGSRTGSPPFDWNDPATWPPVVERRHGRLPRLPP
jgi:uncharacterized protein YbjT (DUF2867 family)